MFVYTDGQFWFEYIDFTQWDLLFSCREAQKHNMFF